MQIAARADRKRIRERILSPRASFITSIDYLANLSDLWALNIPGAHTVDDSNVTDDCSYVLQISLGLVDYLHTGKPGRRFLTCRFTVAAITLCLLAVERRAISDAGA